jgi:transposase
MPVHLSRCPAGYLGIDWSQRKHDAAILNRAGACLAELAFPHTPEGFLKLDETLSRLGVEPSDCLVGLETAHTILAQGNILVDFLWGRGYRQIFVVPPSMVRSNRSRYRQSGAQSDPGDALLLADLLRTDRGNLYPWFPDSLLTRQIRATVSLIRFLTRSVGALSNRLTSVLFRYHPATLVVFGRLTSTIALDFIQAYPTPNDAAHLTWSEFQAFGRAHRYPSSQNLARAFARLQQPQPQPSPQTIQVYQTEAMYLTGLLRQTLEQKKTALHRLTGLFSQHPDRAIFASLPGAGDYLAPALLACFGDDRQSKILTRALSHRRQPPGPLDCVLGRLAGTCPVTKSSGKRRTVHFRRACDRDFRQVAQQWARASLKTSPWASAYYSQVRPRCRTSNQAYRRLANRWLGVACLPWWAGQGKLWQTSRPYDEAYHHREKILRSQPRG